VRPGLEEQSEEGRVAAEAAAVAERPAAVEAVAGPVVAEEAEAAVAAEGAVAEAAAEAAGGPVEVEAEVAAVAAAWGP
jgi:hypothetical protein